MEDQGNISIFNPRAQGVTVHNNDSFELITSKRPLLQGWRDSVGLWTVPLVDEAVVSEGLAINEAVMNVYEFPSTNDIVQFLHAALRFAMKAMLLTVIQNGNLVTFPELTTENLNKFFPESNETKKGHMKQPNQGVRSRIQLMKMQYSKQKQNKHPSRESSTKMCTYADLMPPRSPCMRTRLAASHHMCPRT